MTDFEFILGQCKKYHFAVWDENVMDECVKRLPSLTREELVRLYRNNWVEHEKVLKDAIFQLLFKNRIGERDRKLKAMTVDELIENLYDENGYGKYTVFEMKDRFDSLDDNDKKKVLDTLSSTTKANLKWAEGKKNKMKANK